ncbi:hypothetical protein RE628_07465 [Paenibacillus sp. D2_2]|nr:hypothetical protein [Paenibacillus sp. D2_2]WMT42235.1 hypothetical protein RE628_07465 [Paenibacillus sp. D2_2]
MQLELKDAKTAAVKVMQDLVGSTAVAHRLTYLKFGEFSLF